MALYAFDGTCNENEPDDENDTNVIKFKDAYQGTRVYIKGVGTRFGFIGKLFGGLFGAGGKQRIDDAHEALERNFHNGDEIIDIIGFSRGGALALDFANEIYTRGVAGKQAPPVRFIGIWDAVASFGIPGNDINLGYVLTLPGNVQKCFHGMALDERRHNFNVQRIVATVPDANAEGRVYEVWFRGVHSDIGGGNGNTGLSSISLDWMLQRAEATGLPISQDEINKHRQLMNLAAEISKNLDPVKDPYRTIPYTDVVHHSVTFRHDANNPPIGLQIMDDEGKILEQGFGQTRAAVPEFDMAALGEA